MAPESLRKLVFSTESDVFSFGVTIWEIFTLGDVPFAGLTFCNQFVSDLEGGMRLEEAKYATDDLYVFTQMHTYVHYIKNERTHARYNVIEIQTC